MFERARGKYTRRFRVRQSPRAAAVVKEAREERKVTEVVA